MKEIFFIGFVGLCLLASSFAYGFLVGVKHAEKAKGVKKEIEDVIEAVKK